MSSSENRPKVIVAMPAFNEEKYIGTIILKAKKYADEIVVYDDGSGDDTSQIAQLAGATVLRHEVNQGKGVGVRTLLGYARQKSPDVLVLIDADGQHNPDEIPALVKAVVEGNDLVIGSRKAQVSRTPFYRRLGQNVLSRSVGFASGGRKVTDSESGFRAFSPHAISVIELSEDGFAVDSEIVVKAVEKGLTITEVPISNIYTKNGSTLHPIRHGVGVLARIGVMVSERKPLLFFGTFGSLLAILGVAAGTRVLAVVTESGALPIGTAILAVFLLMVSILSIFTGIILHILTGSGKRFRM